MDNHFVFKKEEYKRDLNILKSYVEDSTLYLHKRTGKPLETCREFVERKTTKDGDLGIQDPEVFSLTRHDPGERVKETIPFSEYLKDVSVNNRLISPTMAVYRNPEDIKSLTSEFIDINIQRRGKSKKEMMAAKERGDEAMAEFKNNEQSSFKISNNSLSGAQASTSTILYNKSAHSSLTSTCRTATSYGNANNEKFLFGNRHYWSPEVVEANIVSVINSTDFELLEFALSRYGIRHPTVEETFESVRYSTDLYWKNEKRLEDIKRLIETLTPIERSAFVYSGDLYHLAKYNDEVIRTFLDKLSSKATTPIDNPDHYIDQMDDDLEAFVSLLCAKEMIQAKKLIGDSAKTMKEVDWEGYCIYGATAKHILDTLDEYQHLIKGLWRVNTLPASVAHIRSSIRRGVITSDTDSTIFTVQDWTEWFTGDIAFDEKSNAVFYAVVYLSTQTIAHILAMISAGMGVEEKYIGKLSMKNEFAFPVFVLTSMAKHYFAYISAQEGTVFDEYDMEVKGVYLKDSNVPPHIMEGFHNTLKEVMDKIMSGGKISLNDMLKKIANIEHGVSKSIRNGDSFYLTRGQVKDPSSYTNPNQSPYMQYLLWEEVFAPRYGAAPTPPYSAVKVSLDAGTRKKLMAWFENIEDPGIRDRLEKWMKENNKQAITSLLLPSEKVSENGVPEEVIAGMNIRKLIYNTVKGYYTLLESLGLFMVNDNLTRLVSDTWKPDDQK